MSISVGSTLSRDSKSNLPLLTQGEFQEANAGIVWQGPLPDWISYHSLVGVEPTAEPVDATPVLPHGRTGGIGPGRFFLSFEPKKFVGSAGRKSADCRGWFCEVRINSRRFLRFSVQFHHRFLLWTSRFSNTRRITFWQPIFPFPHRSPFTRWSWFSPGAFSARLRSVRQRQVLLLAVSYVLYATWGVWFLAVLVSIEKAQLLFETAVGLRQPSWPLFRRTRPQGRHREISPRHSRISR